MTLSLAPPMSTPR
uniref:Uncharacterized protein n=1 Tax=Rhizophora mucronata TaxID=61149 RepID=A0A2P2NTZ2_RHIMU